MMQCPECDTVMDKDEDGDLVCPDCGEVVLAEDADDEVGIDEMDEDEDEEEPADIDDEDQDEEEDEEIDE